ncbi:zinc transporter 6-A-like isoform X11 [Schistocerca gregaria]|uniref:zinc transporter 6-A-like isoform X8 n=1 Tax=Schistocerca gregaria TaxID=7010 RepID=UPI00211F26DA|nr:zinc transporter 6-A-like isoform X8 [Schistocerca gregaria]XP_049834840.1 zinc transporter 6-A-like isoform X9 [Schistocerca gregaria]XP_049834844.1 zinc transporter 6-A-like isoform X11 [Schistocerca gregaria]
MLKKELLSVIQEGQTKHIFILLGLNIICYCVLLSWCSSTQSMALLAYTYTMGFNILSLIICILSVWVKKQKPSPLYSFGYERFEVLAVFGSTVLAQLASVFIIKESIERLILEQTQIHTGRLLVGMGLAFLTHLLVIYGVSNAALEHVIAASSSSWLQEHVSDISQRNYHMADTFAAILIAVMMCATMLPMSVYTGKVLLQTTPSHVIGQLDKCLRESLTIDGVLEFRNEHFWTLSFGKMAGSLHVRVRRDADEQLVLAHIVDKLSNVVSELTVQVFKDEWTLRRGVNNIAPLLSMPNSVPQPFHLNDVSYSRTNSAVNGKNARVPHGNWVDATALPHSGNNYSARLLIPHGATAQTVKSSVPVGKIDSWSNIGNTTNVAPNYNMNIVPATQAVQRSERQTNFNTYESNYVSNSLPLANSSSFQSVDQTSNPFGTLVGTTIEINHSPHKNNPFLHEIPVSMVTNPQNVRNNNLLLSGTNMLDSDKFVYRPH